MLRILLVLAAMFCSTLLHAQETTEQQTAADSPQQSTLDDLRTFSEIFAAVREYYVEEVTDRELLEAALDGMLSKLDPHSEWLSAEDYSVVEESATGRYGGLGIEFQMVDGYLTVITAVDDTPAQQAGLASGDRLIAVDGQALRGRSINDAVELMRGEPGTTVELDIVRPRSDEKLTFTLTREIIHTISVRGRLIEDRFAYLRLASFQEETANQLERRLNDLLEQNQGAVDGIVLDLRNNPGGILFSAVQTANHFLDHGLIVTTRGRSPEAFMEFKADQRMLVPREVPLVVLVNAGSASAAEIVAAALQDHQRAIIVGQRTFGKGSVQSVLEQRNGSAIRLTTSRYYTPDNRPIQLEGVMPDIVLPRVEVSAARDGTREADLERRLDGENDDSDTLDGNETIPSLASQDYALFEAINMLKSLYLAARHR
ncbi:MAG: proteolytic complex protein CptA [Wenzhouxiangellaceae bacterium]